MRLSRHSTPITRTGFTLVELLVAMALIIVIMTIIATAFHTGIDSFRTLKAVGDLSENLRAAEAVMRRDLTAEHLVDENGAPIRVSHPRFNGIAWHPDPNFPGLNGAIGRQGYFVVRQPSPPRQSFNPSAIDFVGNYPPFNAPPLNTPQAYETYPYLLEGTEDGVPSFRATDQSIAFTVRLPGRNNQEVFACSAPNGTSPYNPVPPPPYTDMTRAPLSLEQFTDRANPQFVSRWAEISYFLKPSGILTSGEDSTTQLTLYTMHRRVRVLSPSPVNIRPPAPVPPTYPFNTPQNSNYYREKYAELSVATTLDPNNPTYVVNTPETVNRPVAIGPQVFFPGRTDTIVDWRNFVNPPVNPIVQSVPAGVAETAPSPPPPATPVPYSGTVANADHFGGDVFLNNVLSFHVQVLTDASNATNGWWLDPGVAGNPWPRVYDTANSTARIKGIRAIIRVYDTKMKLTRQITVIQDL